MTSKEALDKISNGYTSDLLTNEWFEWLQIIKQDLERLETVEKENEQFKETRKQFNQLQNDLEVLKEC